MSVTIPFHGPPFQGLTACPLPSPSSAPHLPNNSSIPRQQPFDGHPNLFPSLLEFPPTNPTDILCAPLTFALFSKATTFWSRCSSVWFFFSPICAIKSRKSERERSLRRLVQSVLPFSSSLLLCSIAATHRIHAAAWTDQRRGLKNHRTSKTTQRILGRRWSGFLRVKNEHELGISRKVFDGSNVSTFVPCTHTCRRTKG